MERMMLLVPTDLRDAVDAEAKRLGKNRSQVVREAMSRWLAEERKRQFEALLAQGYQEMALQAAATVSEIEPLQVEAAEHAWRWDD